MKRIISGLSAVAFLLLFSVKGYCQSSAIDWAHDTLTRADATGARATFGNNIRGGGNPNVTEGVNIPTDKLKQIVDACSRAGLPYVSFQIINIRATDLPYFRRQNPGVPDGRLLGSQMLVIRVPRSAFNTGAAASGLPMANPLLMSLATAGIFQLQQPYKGIPFGAGDIYFSSGTICPPPASCD